MIITFTILFYIIIFFCATEQKKTFCYCSIFVLIMKLFCITTMLWLCFPCQGKQNYDLWEIDAV